ncbi:MAG TPA: hypothetical protein VFQ45_05845 [Longimicrobium sp.]|nr:hypothetical protein [Longimicrobium sp.]
MRARTAALLLLPLLTACGGDDIIPPGDYTLEGRWAGTAGDDDEYAFTFVLDQDARNNVAGTATVVTEASTLELDVSGDWDYPNFELVLSTGGYQDVVYSGSFEAADSIDGTLAGSGFENEALTIEREP